MNRNLKMKKASFVISEDRQINDIKYDAVHAISLILGASDLFLGFL